MKKRVILLFILILINLVNAQYIFDLDVEVIPKTLIAPPYQNTIIVNSNIINLGINSDERIDITLSYEIKDKDNKIIDLRSSTVALQTSLSVSEVFNLPSNLKPGKYHVNVEVDYKDYNTLTSKEFYIEEKTFIGKINYLIDRNPVIFVVMFLILVLLFIWWIIHHYHLHHE